MSFNRAFPRQPDGSPVISQTAAYHLENKTFVGYLETVARSIGVTIQDDTVTAVEQDDRGVKALRLASGGPAATADMFVDCSGFESALLGKALAEPFVSFKDTLLCDRAVVGGWDRGADEPIQPYTTAETMDAGWCWRIDHETRVNRGYVYASAFVPDEAAEREFRAANPKVTRTRVVKFVSGRYDRAWVKNVVAVGNAGGFVEPLESTSLAAICNECHTLAETLIDCDGAPTPSLAAAFNRRVAAAWDTIRDFLGLHYKFNTRLDTPFWRACRETVALHGAEPVVEYYRDNGPSTLFAQTLLDPADPFTIEGYLVMLLGQRVPTRRAYAPSAREAEIWRRAKATVRQRAAAGLTVPDALRAVRAPTWRWAPGAYQF
jgi:tryptophan halogenase